MATSYFVYAISADAHFIKFGYAQRPKARLMALQTGSPYKLSILAVIRVGDLEQAILIERLIHLAACRYRTRGEWFRSIPKTLAIAHFMKSSSAESLIKILSGWTLDEVHARATENASITPSNLGRMN